MKPWQTLGWRTLAAVCVLVGFDRGLYYLGDHGKWIVQERHPHLGWQMLPNQNGWSRFYEVRETTNDLGYRGADWPAAPKAVRRALGKDAPAISPVEGDARTDGELRIAVVGNSMTYGSSVEDGDVWTVELQGLLTEELRRRGDTRPVHVQNFAVQGYVFEQMARTFEQRIAPFLPDLLLVPNTTYDLAPMPRPEPSFDYPLRPWIVRTAISDFAVRKVHGRWMPRPPAPAEVPPDVVMAGNRERWEAVSPRARDVAWRLFAADRGAPEAEANKIPEDARIGHFARADEDTLARLWERAKGEERALLLDLLPPGLFERVRQTVQHELSAHPYQSSMRWLWDRSAERLEGLRERLEAHGGRLVLFSMPTLNRVSRPDQPSTSAYWSMWAAGNGGQRRAVEFDPTADLRREMPELAKYLADPNVFHRTERGEIQIPEGAPQFESTLFFPKDVGHLNTRGHRVLAEALAARLLESGALDASR